MFSNPVAQIVKLQPVGKFKRSQPLSVLAGLKASQSPRAAQRDGPQASLRNYRDQTDLSVPRLAAAQSVVRSATGDCLFVKNYLLRN